MSNAHRVEPDSTPGPLPGGEAEFYVEPAPLTRRDAWGVVLALVALALIGAGGYIWLNPQLSLAEMLSKTDPPGPQSRSTVASSNDQLDTTRQTPADSPQQSTSGELAASNALSGPHTHDHDMACPHCGMYSDRSLAHIVVEWVDGTHTHHDCWDCALAWGRDNKLQLARAVVTQHAAALAEPAWLESSTAIYLYDTKPIKGSMPPYVAAFSDRAAAAAAQPELGGEVVDWEGLQAKFAR